MVTIFNNKEVHATSYGKGKALVLLHGFLESKEIWKDFLPELSETRKVIAIDLPGHGLSEVQAPVHTMELMADAVHAVVAQCEEREISILGHSMGGYVALAFLELYPEWVQGITLLNATPQADTEEKRHIRERSIQLVKKNKQGYISMAINNLIAEEHAYHVQDEVDRLKQSALQTPTAGITAALKGMKIRTDRTAILKSFQGSKNLIAGKKDPLIPYRAIKSIADSCNCRFFGLPGGHLSFIEAKEEFKKLCISSKKYTF